MRDLDAFRWTPKAQFGRPFSEKKRDLEHPKIENFIAKPLTKIACQ
jgi:hypothetical protein